MLEREITVLEDLDDHRPVRSPDGCKFGQLLKSLSDSDRAILEEAVFDRDKWSLNALHAALRKKGLDVGYQTMYRHRNLSCACVATNA